MSVDHITDAGKKAKGDRPYFLASEQTEQLMNITMALAQELAVTRERMDTLERLLESASIFSREDIESYVPDSEAAEQRQLWHQEYIARILRIMQQSREAIKEKQDGQPSTEDVMKDISS
ncbi:hypothetical protein [Alteromonas sp. C1M14]|uniref:hypothetical protein n=1 Tax=Alteromonas sp. C1M14 TaxID=2841567 RepID=UPI001C08AC59|nr:hypothetical protein [Alteromonas sp. C1M14]MBU2980027.1 hypothetical protein [Alteromonas sp. C1M14]